MHLICWKHFARQAKQSGAIETDSPGPAHGFIFIGLECRWNANHASHRLPVPISSILLFCALRTEFSSLTTVTPCLLSFWLSQPFGLVTCFFNSLPKTRGFSGDSVAKNLPANTRDACSILGLGKSPGEGNGNPLQYSCLGNPMDRGAWQATVQWVTEIERHDLAKHQQL